MDQLSNLFSSKSTQSRNTASASTTMAPTQLELMTGTGYRTQMAPVADAFVSYVVNLHDSCYQNGKASLLGTCPY